MNRFISVAAIAVFFVQFIFLFNFFYSMCLGRHATQNLWRSNTLG